MSQSWYVRDRGRITGPFTTEQLLDMRHRGRIQAFHEVSTDQRTWEGFDQAFPAEPPPDAEVVDYQSSRPESPQEHTISDDRAERKRRKAKPLWQRLGTPTKVGVIAG